MQQQRSRYVICDYASYVGCSRETANQLPSSPLMKLQLVLQIIQIKITIFPLGDTDNLQKHSNNHWWEILYLRHWFRT